MNGNFESCRVYFNAKNILMMTNDKLNNSKLSMVDNRNGSHVVFEKDSVLTQLLHNYQFQFTIKIQKRYYRSKSEIYIH